MTLHLRIDDGTATLTDAAGAAPEPFATALVEARGALLRWDVTGSARFPDAAISSPREAAGWLADVYGPEIAAAVAGGGTGTMPLSDDAELVDAARRLAHLGWAAAWWPAGVYTPALDPAVLAAEIVVATDAVSHLLDDEDALERTLADAGAALPALALVPAPLRAEADLLAERVHDLADDHGVELQPADTAIRRDEWALAAGAEGASLVGIEIGHGSAPIRWADVPAQTVAADGEAEWSLRRVDGAVRLHLRVAAVPGADAGLRARFGPEELGIDLELAGDGAAFAASAEVPASLALLPLDDRTVWVRDERIAAVPGPPEDEDVRDRVREFAVGRLDDDSSSLAERAAGA